MHVYQDVVIIIFHGDKNNGRGTLLRIPNQLNFLAHLIPSANQPTCSTSLGHWLIIVLGLVVVVAIARAIAVVVAEVAEVAIAVAVVVEIEVIVEIGLVVAIAIAVVVVVEVAVVSLLVR